jgi:membrane associated rhomboid family serine protease
MFFLPLSDDNDTLRSAIVVWLIIGICTAVLIWQMSLPPRAAEAATLTFGMIPARLLGNRSVPEGLALIPAWATLFTSMFLHGGWLHLIGNMWFFRIFGDNVEDAMGPRRFTVFYLAVGAVAAITQAAMNQNSVLPMVGASGAIAGVLGAYLMLYPRANVRVFMFFFLFIRIINVPAILVLGIWFALQLIGAERAPADAGGVAFWAHVGGFLSGLVLLPLFKRGDIPLFGEARSRAFAISGARVARTGRIPTVVPRDR